MEECQSLSPEVVFKAIPSSTVTEPIKVKKCLHYVHSVQYWPPAIPNISILLFGKGKGEFCEVKLTLLTFQSVLAVT